MNNELSIVLTEKEILKEVKRIAKNISKNYEDKNPVIIGILKGSLYFLSDLTKEISIELEIDVMCLSSYGNDYKSSGKVKILKDISVDIENRHVIILEDIIDSGNTLRYLKTYFSNQNAKSIYTISLFKKEYTKVDKEIIDYIGFSLPNKFLVGYGLDYANKYRNLKNIYEIIQK